MQRPCNLSECGVTPWQLQDLWPRPPYNVAQYVARGMREEVFTVLQLALQAANKHYGEALLRAAGSPDFQELPSAGLVQYLEVRSIRTRVFIYS